MVRFFDLLVTKFSQKYNFYSGLGYYTLQDSNLNDDMLRLVGYMPGCSVADVFRKVDRLHGPIPRGMKLQSINELDRRGYFSYSDDCIVDRTRLQLTKGGQLAHTIVHIANHFKNYKRYKEPVGA